MLERIEVLKKTMCALQHAPVLRAWLHSTPQTQRTLILRLTKSV